LLFYIIDDDDGVRAMLYKIIESAELGTVIGESDNGEIPNNQYSILKKVDILLIDLLMPVKDGITTVQEITPFFQGEIIMISQIESKEMISQAYSQGVTYFITKPINKIEILSIIKNVTEKLDLEKSMRNIHQLIEDKVPNNINYSIIESDHIYWSQFLLSEIGIVGETGYQDLLNILDFLFSSKEDSFKNGLLSIKDVFLKVTKEQTEKGYTKDELNKEIKASKQRVRRVIYYALTHLSSLGLNDYMNPIFENYAPKLFDFEVIQKRMYELKNNKSNSSHIRINTKKFILVLYFEVQRKISEY